MRVILDTNVLLSALLVAQSLPSKLLEAWERGAFFLIACPALIEEFRGVAARRFFKARLRASAVELLAAGLRDFSVFYRNLPSGPAAPDPKDSYLLALAETSGADFLVTGDRKLQALERHRSTRIVSPVTMIEILGQAGRG